MTAHLQTYESSTRGSPVQAEDLAAERERIAVGLNDSVIHSMFAASLNLHGALALEASDQVHDRVRAAIGELDRAITVVRTTVFDMPHSSGAINNTSAVAATAARDCTAI